MDAPSLEEFLAAPDADIAAVAPKTVAFAAAGSRRAAACENVAPEQYLEWVTQQLAHVLPIFFRLGVQHLIVPTVGSKQLAEEQKNYGYGRRIIQWVETFVFSEALMNAALNQQFRIRLMGPGCRSVPEWQDLDNKLRTHFTETDWPVLWLHMVHKEESSWSEMLDVAIQHGVKSRAELARIIHGEDIPAVTLLVGSGRWMIQPEIVPLLLYNQDIHCYWTQCPGVKITEQMLRRIIYDLAFSRNTYTNLRSTRYEHVMKLEIFWKNEEIMGVGRREFGFWLANSFLSE